MSDTLAHGNITACPNSDAKGCRVKLDCVLPAWTSPKMFLARCPHTSNSCCTPICQARNLAQTSQRHTRATYSYEGVTCCMQYRCVQKGIRYETACFKFDFLRHMMDYQHPLLAASSHDAHIAFVTHITHVATARARSVCTYVMNV